MPRSPTIYALAAALAALFAASIYFFNATEPTASGFAPGLNRARFLIGGQLAALVVAAIAWRMTRAPNLSGARKRIGFAPFLVSAGALVWFAYSILRAVAF